MINKKRKILVVDDEPGFTRLLKFNLEKTGNYEVREETKGVDVVSVIQEFRPDLVLLDIIMPDIDGGEVASQIRANDSVKDTPILFLTAIVSKQEMSFTNGLIGGHPFLAKPVGSEEVIALIEKTLLK